MMASSLHDHVILVGLGKLGYKVYCQLRALGQSVVVVESDPKCQFLEVVRRDGVPLFIGDARREAILDDANVRKARSIILATDDDLANLETALDARRVAPDIRVVLRMFDQNMADKIKEGFNLHIAMSQSAISAPAFATAAIDGSIVNSFLVDGKVIVMQRWNVRPGGPLDGKSVGDVLSEMGFSVVERRDPEGDKRVFPPADVVLRAGDRLLVQGPFAALSALTRKGGCAVEAGETARAG